MSRKELVSRIANELFMNDMLDENNYSFDTEKMLKDVEGIIIRNLMDYIIISGTVLD